MRSARRAIPHPRGGWLRAVRKAIGISSSSAAAKMGVSRQGYADFERREKKGAISVENLEKAAAALGCDLVYFLVPSSEADPTFSLLAARSNASARLQHAAEHSMMLEGQESAAWRAYAFPPVESARPAMGEDAAPWGQTPIDASEEADLIPPLASREQLNQAELDNIVSARAWALSAGVLARDDLLSDSFLRELHRRMFHRVWRWAGRYRAASRNLGWEPHRITEGVRMALDDARYWFDHGTYSPAEAAVRLHHRLVVVHPWMNGNGRHSRLLADIVLAARGEPSFSWGGRAPGLFTPDRVRKSYLAALQRADQGDYADLIRFCR